MKRGTREIINALAWAAIILVGTWLLRGTPPGDSAFMAGVLGWLLTRDLLVNDGAALRRDWRCIKRRLLRRTA